VGHLGGKSNGRCTSGLGAFKGQLSVWAWATICRAGAYHAPHSHPDSAWSGVYYVDAGKFNPNRPLSGVLEFLDPRVGVEAVSTPGDPTGNRSESDLNPGCLLPSLAGSITGCTPTRANLPASRFRLT